MPRLQIAALGDMVTGDIHEELAERDGPADPTAPGDDRARSRRHAVRGDDRRAVRGDLGLQT